MCKKSTTKILEYILHNSPNQITTRLSHLGYRLPKNQLPVSDTTYLDTNLSNIFCDFLLNKDYSHINYSNMNTNYNSILNKNPQLFYLKTLKKEYVDLQNRFITNIKKLNQHKVTVEIYEDIQDIMEEIQKKDVNVYKRYLMYIYKQIVRSKVEVDFQVEEAGRNLMSQIEKKLVYGQIRPEDKEIIMDQFERIRFLAKARDCQLRGDHEQATANYQLIFEGIDYDENSRMEALQYLCKNSRIKGDISYLQNMIIKIKQNQDMHRFIKYIENTMKQIILRPESASSSENIQQ